MKPVLFQSTPNRLYFNKFKEQSVHFNGTVVIRYQNLKNIEGLKALNKSNYSDLPL